MTTDVYTTTSYLQIGNIHRYIIKYKLYERDIEDLYQIPECDKKYTEEIDLSIENLDLHEKRVPKLSKRSFVDGVPDKIVVTITNTIPISMRATGVLLGPYSLYVDLKKQKFNHKNKFFESSDIPKFEANLLPAQAISFELSLNDLSSNELIWELNVISQALFTTNCKVFYDMNIHYHFDDKIYSPNSKVALELLKEKLLVTKLETSDLWNFPMIQTHNSKKEKCHLVILTHGMMSNLTADMLYLAEQIRKREKNCIIVGYAENVCKTERGVRYQGIKNGEFIINEIKKNGIENISKISFIGHSLGGLIQTFSISYCFKKYPEIMSQLNLENFITLASPLLGVLNDNPKYLQKLLTIGLIGKSGQDLGLTPLPEYNNQPFLFLLLCAHTRNCLRKFRNRTIYANSINDGIVPLYTSSLLFVDYVSIVAKVKKMDSNMIIATTNLQTDDLNKAQLKANIDSDSRRNKFFWKPLLKMSTLFAPQGVKTDVVDSDDDYSCISGKKQNNHLPKLSLFDTAQHVLLQLAPGTKYIMDPDSRESTIVHDKKYTYNDIEKLMEDKTFKALLNADNDYGMNDDEIVIEEELAHKWHKNLDWRKVVVALEPDAHNNINVRRQFQNAYGWEVVDHIVDNHFGEKESNEQKEDNIIDKVLEEDTNDVINYNWLLTFEQESVIDGGVTGMIPTVADLVDKWYRKMALSISDNDIKENKNNQFNGHVLEGSSSVVRESSINEEELMLQYYTTNI
ncbi:hypothetical protein QEN19_003140 [Hanseniaspora menglaensis]